MHLLPSPLFTNLAIFFFLFISTSATHRVTSPTAKLSIEWDLQFNSSDSNFQSVGLCKGTTDETSKVGFVVGKDGEYGAIWRTLNGVTWKQVAQFPMSAFFYGIYCFPDAQRVIAVGWSEGDITFPNGAIITWSFDGGNSWTDRQSMPATGYSTLLQAVHFYNDTHGIILPLTQDYNYHLMYYTTNGGKNASDWQVTELKEPLSWNQDHPMWVFGDVTKTIAEVPTGDPFLCSTNDIGVSWSCNAMNQPVTVGIFVTLNDGIGIDNNLNVYSTTDGGLNWNATSVLPSSVGKQMVLPSDMVWIPNSEVVILVGGTDVPFGPTGTVAHSLDRGLTWTQSMPQLPTTLLFSSVDYVATSPTTTDVWAVGTDPGASAVVIHATFTVG